ncbi:serine/threonine protein kinase [Rhodococcus sp. 15-649-1-2]|uniref:serine/threonine-protein kinase n=1 Tax=Nocardiaceae TaxID=85025 RepID=UPI000522E967|nr:MULTISPECIES: serine/threonine-protein kinase [Rhodococcus]OZD15283.1 serine/threonine protein kinase [Rhodococcus sp. 06-156-4C]OZD19629.1 serine/threonine protein kinase [Rhodococcus sp. 06-156-4a]OZD23060.1 serine/threonine protein kinase [Rhodococcus sp. 06-156-3C]OZD25647.1 serine/threonine protein kinase [Rhodococcus sp. 06-156-3b]OZD37854.1 serine/threonine protein kinase [Rhodococcus sp. 06-156-3]
MTPGRLSPGRTFAGYTVERLLGVGGMSEVYLVEGRETLKILDEDASGDEQLRAKFVMEAKIAARLHHPNIVSVHAHGEFGGRLWMTMHYVEGYSAARLVARGQIALDVDRAARIVSEVAKGLDYAHTQGVLHRDVKPSNILISTEPRGGFEQVMVSDWGIARFLDAGPVARGGSVFASIQYAAPELLRGERLSARTDVYALGATLVELLTGKPPYPLATPLAITDAQLNASPPSVTARRRDLRKGLDGVVATALAKKPEDRFATCTELSNAVADALAAPAPEPPPRKSPFGAGWRRRF